MQNPSFDEVYSTLKANFRKAYVNKKTFLTRNEIIKILESFLIYDDFSNVVIQQAINSLEADGLIKRFHPSDLEDGNRIFLYCGTKDPYVEVLNDGIPLPDSEVNYLKEVLLSGLSLHTKDGPTNFWSRKGIYGLIGIRGAPNDLDSPQIQKILKELEESGHIQFIGKEDTYLKFLG